MSATSVEQVAHARLNYTAIGLALASLVAGRNEVVRMLPLLRVSAVH